MRIYPKQFYVYMYLREDGTPYYIGKGKHNRAWKSDGRSVPKPPDDSRIAIHSDNLTEEHAFSLEKDLIAQYGRKDNGTGILRNLTDGGDGISGYICSQETKRKMSEAKTGRKCSQETRRKISSALYGKTRSEEARRKMSESRKGKNNPNYGKTGKNHQRYGKGRPCLVNGVRYETVREAAEEHGLKYTTAYQRAKNGKMGWSYV